MDFTALAAPDRAQCRNLAGNILAQNPGKNRFAPA